VYVVAVALVVTPLMFAEAPEPIGAQTPGPPTSPATPSAPPKSTALIIGHVTDGSTGQPIPEAIVWLRPTSPGARGAGGLGATAAGFATAMAGDPGSAAAAAAMAGALARGEGAGPASLDQRLLTGSDGRFVFHTLPPGQYQLSVSLNGYAASLGTAGGESTLMMLVAAGGRMMANAPATYAVGEGEVLKDIRLRLWKHASVAGTVLDDAGEPAVGLTVQAMRRTLIGGRARYAPAGTGRTDDRGVYRIASLMPGDYLIVMPQTQMAVPAAMIEKIVEMGVTGKVDPADQASIAAIGQLLATTGGGFGAAMNNGVRLGSYMVASGGGSLPLVGPDGYLSTYRTAFFSDASTPVDATIVSLKSGDERAGADFQLRLTPTVAVSGIAMGPDGPAANLAVRLVVPGDRIVSDTEFDVATSVTTGDGRFSFYGVPPGQFLLRALKSPFPTVAAGMSAGSSPSEVPLFAVVDVTVGTTDIQNLTVQLAETFSISGRVDFEGRAGAAAPATLKGAGVMLLPADGQAPNILTMGRPAPVSEDGTFLRAGLVPGRYFLDLPTVPAPWQVKSATLDGRDVLDAPLEIRSGNVAGVVITLTDRLGQLSGTVTASSQGRPGDAAVILFPADYRAWIDNGMNPRLARTTRATSSGAYTIPRLTSGDYVVVAIDRSEEGDLQDPAFIDLLSRGATRVAITTEARTQALTVTRVRR
jgi:hypothetical protein